MERRLINANHLLEEIAKLKESPWFNNGKFVDAQITGIEHALYLERKEAVEVVEDLCVKKEPTVQPETTLVPIANVQFDDDKLREIVDDAVSRISIKYNWHDAKKELPPEGRHILVTLDHGGGDLEVTEIDYGVCRYMAEHEHAEEWAKLLLDVVAWMELPGPWEKESS